jgi:IS30 family transposase
LPLSSKSARRAYFEQHRSIMEIVRTLSVSRATVRKIVRGHQTEFKYERGQADQATNDMTNRIWIIQQ